jgi:hypothetical protein
VADPAARLLSAAVTAPQPSHPHNPHADAAGALDALAAAQPQLALAAEQGRAFLVALLTFPAVQAHLRAEETEHDGRDPLWAIVAEAGTPHPISPHPLLYPSFRPSTTHHPLPHHALPGGAAGMLARRGMPEDRHLCLFAAGWRGLLAWCAGQRGPPLLGAQLLVARLQLALTARLARHQVASEGQVALVGRLAHHGL